MALTRRQWLLTLPLLMATIASCGSGNPQGERNPYKELLNSGGGAGSQKVLVFMPDTPQTHDVWMGLCDEVGNELHLIAIRVEHQDADSVVVRAIRRHHPIGVVLMNNPTVASYKRAQQRLPMLHRLPAVVVMTSFLESDQLREIGGVGISYEVPLVTAVTTLRRLLASRIENIGVVYREPLAPFIDRQTRLAAREQVRVIRAPVSADPNSSEIKRALRLVKQRADALWVVNDDRLLNPGLIAEGWLPGLDERPWRPAIVGAASLLSTNRSLGTVAVLPDHIALGTQTANLLLRIVERGWSAEQVGEAQYPLSTTTTLDLPQVKERFSLLDGAVAQVDRILE